METNENAEKLNEGRRSFLQAGSAALLGLTMPEALSARARATESLALFGGPEGRKLSRR